MSKNRKDRIAVLSGSMGHVGSAIAERLRDAGWRVVGLTHDKTHASEDVHVCDVADAAAVESAIERIAGEHGSIEACIHAAVAPIENKPLTHTAVESFDVSLMTAVRGAFLLAKAVVPHMQKHAAFIGITSKLIERETELMPMGAYIPAKYALHGFLRALAADTKGLGIRVYAVSPGFIAGGLNRNVPKPILELLAKKSGVGETSAAEVARVVQEICSNPDAYPPSSSISIPGKAVPL